MLIEPAEVGRGRRAKKVTVIEERGLDEPRRKVRNGTTATGVEKLCLYLPIALLCLCMILLLICLIFSIDPFRWFGGASSVWGMLPKPPGLGKLW